MKILVTDGNNRVALAIIRALGIAGADITCVEQAPFARLRPVSFASKYVRKSLITPAITDSGFINALLDAAKGHDILLPVSTNLVLTVVKHKELFEKHGIKIPFADIGKILSVNDKFRLIPKARAAGIPVPQTFAPDGLDDALKIAKKLDYPVVLKLCTDETLYLEPSQRYAIINSENELPAEYRRLSSLNKQLLLQEYIRGKGYGFFCLMDNESNPIATFCHERLREYPVSGGPSTLCRSIHDKKLTDYGLRLLKAINWTGIAMVEFKKSRHDGEYYLMEINPRYWGSLPLATFAGVNFPLLHCKSAMGEKMPSDTHYKADMKLRFIATDILSLYSSFKAGGRGIEWADDMLDYIFGRSIPDGIFDCTDPRPGLLYIKNRFSNLIFTIFNLQ
ncbi:MAG: ATP-grasp domain-containing protein [Planctomycetes bacterium]|nr:ATP-grasp domain-containing protein [Planctomycetota bacterium]